MADGSAHGGNPPPGNASLHSSMRVNTFCMFGEGATSSSYSSVVDGSALDPSPDPDRATPSAFFFFFFFRELWPGEESSVQNPHP